jgi:ABC-type nickel/cobalt efflux system permease component RcnA
MVNKSIEFYDQVEVIPIYLSMLIFLNCFCGGMILDEYLMYSIEELFNLFACCLICSFGIWILIRKPDFCAIFKKSSFRSNEEMNENEDFIRFNSNL